MLLKRSKIPKQILKKQTSLFNHLKTTHTYTHMQKKISLKKYHPKKNRFFLQYYSRIRSKKKSESKAKNRFFEDRPFRGPRIGMVEAKDIGHNFSQTDGRKFSIF